MPSITDYQQYREFLREYYLDQKRRKTGLTYATFSRRAGIKSPNFLKLVIEGEKNLTSENALRFARALALKSEEADYFEALVSLNQSSDPLQREFYGERVERIRKRLGRSGEARRLLEEAEFEVISDWKYHALMVMTGIPGFEERPAWIRERLYGLVTEAEIVDMLAKLERLKLIGRDGHGRLRQTHRQVTTGGDIKKALSRAFYEGLFARASLSLKLIEPEEREFQALVVTLSQRRLPELKKRVREFIEKLHEWALEDPKPTQTYALQFAAFPLTSAEKRHSQ